MTEIVAKTYNQFALPPSVVSKIDVSRIVAEAEMVDNELTTAAVRAKVGTQAHALPTLSQQLTEFMTLNRLTFTADSHARTQLITELRRLKDAAPVVHMTFAVRADPESLHQLAAWLRASVHPQAVIEVGLQPALIAGVYLRTQNQVKDLSLRKALEGRRELLVQELEALRGVS